MISSLLLKCQVILANDILEKISSFLFRPSVIRSPCIEPQKSSRNVLVLQPPPPFSQLPLVLYYDEGPFDETWHERKMGLFFQRQIFLPSVESVFMRINLSMNGFYLFHLFCQSPTNQQGLENLNYYLILKYQADIQKRQSFETSTARALLAVKNHYSISSKIRHYSDTHYLPSLLFFVEKQQLPRRLRGCNLRPKRAKEVATDPPLCPWD